MAASNALERYRKSVEVGMRDEERAYLSTVEKRIKQLENYLTLGKNPAIQDFSEWAKRDISSINVRLSTERELMLDGHAAERLAMLDRKDVLLYLIGLLDPSAELEVIENQLNEDAERYEGYQEGRGGIS